MMFKLPEQPKIGDTRTLFKFAWWPAYIPRLNSLIWLSNYQVEQEYVSIKIADSYVLFEKRCWQTIKTDLVFRKDLF